MKIKNSQGSVFYGMHFYPGLAEYQEPDGSSFRIFINEDTIRKMGPTFSGRPIFVEHVEEVDQDLGELRKEADGWVIESFFNAADGKTWAKFIVVSERGLTAIRQGYRLSNAYIPKGFGTGGLWNGVTYQKEVLDGEFEHLAIVQNPRYEESVIMTPEQFKAYCEEKTGDLKRLSNSKEQKETEEMKLNIFKRTKVENATDLDGLMVELPKTKKEMPLVKIVNDYDAILNMNGYANGDHMVKVGEKDEMSVNDLVKKHMAMCSELEKMKNAETEDGGEPGKGADDDDDMDPAVENESLDIDQNGDVGSRGGDKSLDNEEDEEKDEKTKADKMKNEADAKKAKAKQKAQALKNAQANASLDEEEVRIDLSVDQVARGKARYGSN